MKKIILLVAFFLCFATHGFGGDFVISSADFHNGGDLPLWCTTPAAGGKNISPEISWQNPPPGTKSFALALIDEHPIAHRWIHWIVINIPKNVNHLSRGASRRNIPDGAIELFNSYGFLGYGGPQPPRGSGVHRYVFTLYALKVPEINLPPKMTADEFERTIAPYVLGKATMVGLFER